MTLSGLPISPGCPHGPPPPNYDPDDKGWPCEMCGGWVVDLDEQEDNSA